MRTVGSDITDAIAAGFGNPLLDLDIGGVDYTSRIISYEYHLEPYRSRCVMALANSDRVMDSTTLQGKTMTLSVGYGTDVEALPTLFVKNWSIISLQGRLVYVIEAEGTWNKLREFNFITTSVAPYFNIPFTSILTVMELIELALNEAGSTLTPDSSTLDGIINSFKPVVTINPIEFESPAAIIYRMLGMTKCYLRDDGGNNFTIIFPQTSDAAVLTYTDPKEYVEKTNLLIPNHIVVFANKSPLPDEDGKYWNVLPDFPLITGHARDSDQFTGDVYSGNYDEIIEYHIAPFITTESDTTNRAEAILSRYKSETLAGRLVLPFCDPQPELFDKIDISDSRGI